MINAVEDLYLTYSTVMKDLIDDYEKERMMNQVLNDLQNNEVIIEYTKKQKRKKRIFLCNILMDWFLAQEHLLALRYDRMKKREFIKTLDKSFSEDVVNCCYANMKSKDLLYTVTSKPNNSFNITMFLNEKYPYGEIATMSLKYHEKNNTLKICYIFHQEFFDYIINEYIDFTLNLFKSIENIKVKIEEKYSKTPILIYNKKYEKFVNEAYNKKYLENLKKIN